MSHLNSLNLLLSNERMMLSNAKSDSEKSLRSIWVKQLEKEVSCEEKFISDGLLSDDELLAELLA